MQSNVPVAEPEPRGAAERACRCQRVPALVGASPAAFLVSEPGKPVENAVQIGRDGETEHLEVVADVDDRRHVGGVDRSDHAAEEPYPTSAAGQHGDLHRDARAREFR